MDHTWVATVWMQQLGLGQHADTVMTNLVDGRVLNSLTRREIDKMLGINRRFHQVCRSLAVSEILSDFVCVVLFLPEFFSHIVEVL